jgi:site-specific recombinase XerD
MFTEIQPFIAWVRRCNAEARTWRDYTYDLHQFIAVVGDHSPNTITARDVDRFVSAQIERKLKATTINRRLAAITSFYAFLALEDEYIHCPVISRRHRLKEPQRLPRPVSQNDQARFFAAINSARDQAMFTIMLRCGLRISEVAHLQLADLYLDDPTPRLLTRGKGSRERMIYLSPQAERALRAYITTRPKIPEDAVFLSAQHHSLSSDAIHRRVVRYRRQAGLHLSAHRLRHSFATELLQAGMPVTSIQKLMGHRWLETTQNYLLVSDQQVHADYVAASHHLEGWG